MMLINLTVAFKWLAKLKRTSNLFWEKQCSSHVLALATFKAYFFTGANAVSI